MPRSPIVWQSGPWTALAKPAGLTVFPLHAEPAADCLLHRLTAARPEVGALVWPAGFDGGLAHRLDRATSGMVLAASTPDALTKLRGWFSAKRLDKTYHFVTARGVPWETHTVRFRLAHDRRKKSRMTFERGRETPHRGRWLDAETTFRRLGRCGPGLWRWEARMRTGVTHQIRVHAAAAGLALAGDTLYGGGTLDLDRPTGARFLLHHRGLKGPGLAPSPQPVPDWWPLLE